MAVVFSLTTIAYAINGTFNREFYLSMIFAILGFVIGIIATTRTDKPRISGSA